MVDGTAALMAMFYSMSASGVFGTERGTNMLDGGAHFYDTYETADGEYISIGSIEPQFCALLMEKAGLDADYFQPQMDRGRWGELKAKLTEVFLNQNPGAVVRDHGGQRCVFRASPKSNRCRKPSSQ